MKGKSCSGSSTKKASKKVAKVAAKRPKVKQKALKVG